jgi:hypothetical protein
MISRRHLLLAAPVAPGLIVPPVAISPAPASRGGAPGSALDRVHRCYAEFASAMDELTAAMSNRGWILYGAGRKKPFRHHAGSAWAMPKLVHCEAEEDRRCTHGCLVTEWFRDINGLDDLERPIRASSEGREGTT